MKKRYSEEQIIGFLGEAAAAPPSTAPFAALRSLWLEPLLDRVRAAPNAPPTSAPPIALPSFRSTDRIAVTVPVRTVTDRAARWPIASPTTRNMHATVASAPDQARVMFLSSIL